MIRWLFNALAIVCAMTAVLAEVVAAMFGLLAVCGQEER